VIQACGRVVRAPDDYGATYLADSSLLDLFDRTTREMPAWFRDQVDRVSVPDLPGFEAAANAASASRSGGSAGRSSSAHEASTTGSRIERDASDSAGRGNRTGEGGTHVESEGAGGRDSDHPLSDVWGDE
jgi:hypothetical protein